MFKILGEDKVMVEKLTPERLHAEFSLGPDAPQVGFGACSGPSFRGSWGGQGHGGETDTRAAEFSLGPDAPQVRGLVRGLGAGMGWGSKIRGEDKVMVEKLTPERLHAEFSLGPDAPQVGFGGLQWAEF
jgi:hypothetical protein